jgi:hypothetical protein
MRNTTIAAISLAALTVSTPAVAKKEPQLSGLALQQIQARDYEAPKEVTFPSVMTILQDSGYRIQAADRDTGLITAMASTKSKMTWAPFVGFGKSKKTPVVSAYIEDRGAGSRVRLSFVMAKAKSNAYGTALSDEEPITDPATYRDAFERIEKELFVRQALTPQGKAALTAAVRPATDAVKTEASATTNAGLSPDPEDMPSAMKAEPK